MGQDGCTNGLIYSRLKMSEITFLADLVQTNGPRRTDNGYTVKFETGENEQMKIAQLNTIPPRTLIKVTVTIE